MCPRPSSWGYLMWRALVGLGRSGCLVLRADTRENPAGKNGVMTLFTLIGQIYNFQLLYVGFGPLVLSL